MFEHRKYHWLYFVLGICIAVILATLMGCEQPNTTGGIYEEPPIQCCMALTPECYAQCEGIPVDVWIENTCGINATDAEYGYWDEEKNEPVWLCRMEIID
jgi:hypothetical protein|tara:strand:- start:352 stop:651 length:300 start_codon:yes stop_codon:yes gene_type:complete